MPPASLYSVHCQLYVSTSHSSTLNIGPGLVSKLFVMSQILLVGLPPIFSELRAIKNSKILKIRRYNYFAN